MNEGILDCSGDDRQAGPWRRPQWVTRLTAASGMCAPDYLRTLGIRLVTNKCGAVTAEYAFLIVFISILAALGMVLLGDDLQTYFENLGAALGNASTPTPDPFAS